MRKTWRYAPFTAKTGVRFPLGAPFAYKTANTLAQVLARIVLSPDHDMAVRVAGVEMIDGDPIEPGFEVVLHLAHHVAGEGAQIGKPVAVLGRDDEPELVAVLPPGSTNSRPSAASVSAPYSLPRSPSRVVPSRCKQGR